MLYVNANYVCVSVYTMYDIYAGHHHVGLYGNNAVQ